MSAGEATPALLEARGLRKAFGGNVFLDDVKLQFQARRVSALIGPNGAGKTTCFNILTGVLAPDRGEIRYGGQDITSLSPGRRGSRASSSPARWRSTMR